MGGDSAQENAGARGRRGQRTSHVATAAETAVTARLSQRTRRSGRREAEVKVPAGSVPASSMADFSLGPEDMAEGGGSSVGPLSSGHQSHPRGLHSHDLLPALEPHRLRPSPWGSGFNVRIGGGGHRLLV